MRVSANIALYIGGLILLLISVSYVRKTFEIMKNGERITEVRKELAQLNTQKEALEGDIRYMQTPEFIEKSARTDLNMVKPNELVFVPENSLKLDAAGQLAAENAAAGVVAGSSEKRNITNPKPAMWLKYFWY